MDSCLAYFPLLLEILPVKSLCTLTTIARVALLALLLVEGHGGCCKIFDIWNNRLISNPFWKLSCRLLGWVSTRSISLWRAVFIDMALFTTLVTSHIRPGRWPSSRDTNISTVAAPEINMLQILVDWLFNVHSVCLCKWRLVLRLLP